MAAQQQCRASDEYVDSPNWPAYNGPSTGDDAGAISRRLADPSPSTNLCACFKGCTSLALLPKWAF